MIKNPLTFEFMMGFGVGGLIQDGRRSRAWPSLMVGFVGVGAAAFWGHALSMSPLFFWLRPWVQGLPFAFLVYGVAALEIKQQRTAPVWLVRLGDASYSTYLGHVLILSALGRVFRALPFHTVAWEIFFVVSCLLAANSVGLLSHRWIEKPSQVWLRRKCSRA